MIMTVTFNADSHIVLDNFDGSPLILSNDKFELIQEIISHISKFEIGDILSISLVKEPDEKDLDAIEEHKDYELAVSSSFDFDD